MSQPIIQLTSPPIGQGRERVCYLHPEDDSKLIKVATGDENVQTRREIDFYNRLRKRSNFPYTHLPEYHGQVQTNLGSGIVVDLVRDLDGEISRSMHSHLTEGVALSNFEPMLAELKNYLLQQRVIINHDLVPGNLLLQHYARDASRLVVIDGLGDVVIVQWLNYFPSHARAKINRRWDRFRQRIDRAWGQQRNRA